ncbi:hypothetical protein ACFL2H_05405 [Planctomycetota bacterium]
MSLPTNAQMETLGKLVVDEGKRTHGKWYTYEGMKRTLQRSGGFVTQSAAKTAVTHGAAAAGVATGTMFVPFGAVLSPWIGAASVVKASGDIFDLDDLLDHNQKKTVGHYNCNCGSCQKNVKYVLDKKERNVARIAVGVGTVGVSAIFTSLNSIRKSFQSGRPKEMTCKGLVESARAGCTLAMATIFLLSGKWVFTKGANVDTMNRAIAIITSEDGRKTIFKLPAEFVCPCERFEQAPQS